MINFENHIFNRTASYNIKKLSSSFHQTRSMIKGSLQTDIEIKSIQLADRTFLENKLLSIETYFSFDRVKLFFNVQPSNFYFANGKFDFKI